MSAIAIREDQVTSYVPSGTVALTLVNEPVKVSRSKAPKPVQHCSSPACDNVIGAGGLTPRARKGRRFCSDECQRTGRRHERRTETADYLGMAARIVRSAGRRVGTDFDDLAGLVAVQAEVNAAMSSAVTAMRERGISWAEIGAQVGISKQGAQQRWGR